MFRLEAGLNAPGQALFDVLEVLHLRDEEVVEGLVGGEGAGWNGVPVNGCHKESSFRERSGNG